MAIYPCKNFFMQLNFKKTILLSTLLFMAVCAFSQRQLIGRVVNKNGVGIASAGVQLFPSKRNTITDITGNFKINATDNDRSIEASSLGFITQRIDLNDRSQIEIVLPDDTKNLTDVVITAYGIRKEAKRVGYSIQELKGDAVTRSRDANPMNALVGKIAGLTVGANPEMLGRPQIVLRGSTDLLYVVDGVPINTDTWNISPDDIESYSVLKGNTASALFGSRGLNGAILITTKRSSKDKRGWVVEVNSTNQVETGYLALPQSQYEYGRGKNFQYSYGDVLYDNKQRLPEWGPRFEGQLVKQ